jgi:ribonuclease III
VSRRKPTQPDLSELETRLQYAFRNRELLERGLTHRSWAHEQTPNTAAVMRRMHNEVFEFLGDSALGFVVAEYLCHKFPDATEGELSRMKHTLVCAPTLAFAAERLALGEYLRVGRGEEKTGGRRKQALLADAYEAILAAVFFDGGFDAARAVVKSTLALELDLVSPANAAATDYKTMLQEVLQAAHKPPPQYELVQTAGPPHRRVFEVELVIGDERIRAEGKTIKIAETNAARLALDRISVGVEIG